MPPRCSSCGAGPETAGPLCLGECPWERGRAWLQCKKCVEAVFAFAADMTGLAETLADRADHYASCTFCWSRKGLLLPGPLAAACLDARRARERKAVAA